MLDPYAVLQFFYNNMEKPIYVKFSKKNGIIREMICVFGGKDVYIQGKIDKEESTREYITTGVLTVWSKNDYDSNYASLLFEGFDKQDADLFAGRGAWRRINIKAVIEIRLK